MTTNPAPFDYDAPLPDLRIPQAQSWEPAARHYRDITADDTATEATA